MVRSVAIFSLTLLLMMAGASVVSSTQVLSTIGIVKFVSGTAAVVSAGMVKTPVKNMRIQARDIIRTCGDGYIGIIFDDDTVMSLGPESEMVVEACSFDPVAHRLSFAANMIRGTFAYISGQIAKLAPSHVKLATPNTTLGIRGTKLVVQVE